MSKRLITIFTFLVLVGISFNLYNFTFHGHVHIVNDCNAIIYHAHPSQSQETARATTTTKQTHQKLELLFLQQIIHLIEEALVLFFLFFFILQVYIKHSYILKPYLFTCHTVSIQLRAPPFPA